MKKTAKNDSKLVQLRQSGILLRLASGESIASIARDTGQSQRHLYRLAEQQHGIISDAVDEAHNRVRSRLPDLVTTAMDILESQMRQGGPDTKRRAARTLLNIATRMASSRCDQCDHVRTIDQ